MRNVLDGKITDWFRVTQCAAESQSPAAQRKRARRQSERVEGGREKRRYHGVNEPLLGAKVAKHFIIHGSYIGRQTNFVSRAAGNLSDIFG